MVALLAAAFVFLAGAEAWGKEAHIVSYGGFGTTDGVVLRGRVVAGAPPSGAKGKGKLRKAASTAKAFLRGDVENAAIVVTDPSGESHQAKADDEGFYDVSIPGPLETGRRDFAVTLAEPGWSAPTVQVNIDVLDASKDGMVVVTDIDDTIVETGVTGGKAALITRVATSNAEDMAAYPLAPDTLRAFADAGVPVIYLTAGPVELAPRTLEFLARNGFPPGAIFFRYYMDHGAGDPTDYKMANFERILQVYAKRKLVLFGDNGEKDPELFAAVAARTQRVAGAYIRATKAAEPTESRYEGMTLYETWRDVARDAGKKRLIRWMAAHKIALAGDAAR